MKLDALNPRIQLLFVLIIVILPIWAHIDDLPIQLWDESRMVNNAFEMYKDHNWIVTHYNYMPDMWCTKPPLLIWLQVASLNLFGVSELSVRIPSAVAGTATCLFLYWFISQKLNNRLLAFISVVIMVSSYGFIRYEHSPRTGDYDALLTFFSTAYLLFYYLFLAEGKEKYMYLTMACLILAAMSKSITALIFLPSVLAYTVYKRKLPQVLRSPAFYIGIVGFCVIVLGYYWLRESRNPGYLYAVQINDLFGRIGVSMDPEKHYRTPFYYYDLIKDINFRFWYFFIPFGILFGFFAVEKLKDITVYALLLCPLYFLVISVSGNKHDWYDMPLYPFFSLLAAIGIYLLGKIMANLSLWRGTLVKNRLPYLFLLLPAVPAYGVILTESLNPDPGEWIVENTSLCKYLKEIYNGHINMGKHINVVEDLDYHPNIPDEKGAFDVKSEFYANIVWYKKILKEKDVDVSLLVFDSLHSGQKVLVSKPALMARIENSFNYALIESVFNDKVRLYELYGKKH